MPRTALDSSNFKIDQRDPIAVDPHARKPEFVQADESVLKDTAYADELAFNEEPVTIRLEHSAEKNAATRFPIWNNGKGCEVWLGPPANRWVEMPYIPVGMVITIKRKYLEILIRAKSDRVDTTRTEVRDLDDNGIPNNVVTRVTSAANAFSIISDPNPRGPAWFAELYRRNG